MKILISLLFAVFAAAAFAAPEKSTFRDAMGRNQGTKK